MLSSKHLVKFKLDTGDREKDLSDSFTIKNVNWRGFMISHDQKYIFTLNNSFFGRQQTSGFKFYVKKDISKYNDPESYID